MLRIITVSISIVGVGLLELRWIWVFRVLVGWWVTLIPFSAVDRTTKTRYLPALWRLALDVRTSTTITEAIAAGATVKVATQTCDSLIQLDLTTETVDTTAIGTLAPASTFDATSRWLRAATTRQAISQIAALSRTTDSITARCCARNTAVASLC